jgi:mono/diheme cytochrome c family protein
MAPYDDRALRILCGRPRPEQCRCEPLRWDFATRLRHAAPARYPTGMPPPTRHALDHLALLFLVAGGLTACERGPALDPGLASAPLPASADPVDTELADAGAWYFRRNCAACHRLGGEALIGPDLAGVTERRDMRWIAAMIRRPDSMLVADSLASALLETYQIPMTTRGLDGARIRAILEFLRRADRGEPSEG